MTAPRRSGFCARNTIMQSSVAVTVSRPPSSNRCVVPSSSACVRGRPSISPCTMRAQQAVVGMGALLLDLRFEVVLDRLARGFALLLGGAVLVVLRADRVVAPTQELRADPLGAAPSARGRSSTATAWRSPRGSRTRRAPTNSSMISLTSLRASGSRSFIRLGENCGSSKRRYFAWSGGSTDSGMSGTSLPMLTTSFDEKTSGCLSAQSTSS